MAGRNNRAVPIRHNRRRHRERRRIEAEGLAARSRLKREPVGLAMGSQYCTFRMRPCTRLG